MVNINDISSKFPGKEIYSIFDGGKYFVVSAVKKGESIDDALDCMYTVDKSTGKVDIFSVAERTEEFKKVLKKPLYIKRK